MVANETPPKENIAPQKAVGVSESSARHMTSEELFEGASEVQIDHSGSIYRLRLTRQGKLILNK